MMPLMLTIGILSVLALSSRFDGQFNPIHLDGILSLSVLALSSRFDGRLRRSADWQHSAFQYSLCRVVLMVIFWLSIVHEYNISFSTRSVESF